MTFLVKSAVKFALDVVVLVAMGVILGRKRRPRYYKLALGALAVAGGYVAYDLLPRWLLGYLFVVPLAAAAWFVLVRFGRLRWKPAAIASLVFILIHTVAYWVLR